MRDPIGRGITAPQGSITRASFHWRRMEGDRRSDGGLLTGGGRKVGVGHSSALLESLGRTS
jgi:hypothetical protein